jgi:hypothetical protein
MPVADAVRVQPGDASGSEAASPRRIARIELLGIALVVAAAFLLRFWGVTHMHFWDENVYLLNAEYFYSGHAGYTEIDERPPLLPLLFTAAFHLWHSDYAAEIVTALLNALGPVFLYLAGRKMMGRSAAAIAALLLAFGPFFVGACPTGSGGFVENCDGHSLLTDCPALTLIALALWLGVRALEKHTSLRFAWFGFAMALPVLMRFGSLSSVGILALLALGAKRRVRAAAACGAGFVVGMGPYLCWSRIRYGGFFETLHRGWQNFGGDKQPLDYYVKILPEMITWIGVAGLVMCLVRRGVELWRARMHGKPTGDAVATRRFFSWDAFLWFWAAAVLVFFSTLNHQESRYGLPFTLPLLLLAGVGLSWPASGTKRPARIAGAALVGVLMIAACWMSFERLRGPFVDRSESEEMVVGEYLKSSLPPTAIVYANLDYPDFAYYSGLQVIDLPESGPELDTDLAQLPANSIFVAEKADPMDGGPAPQPPIAQMDADPRFVRLKDLPAAVIYRRVGF